MKLRISQSTYDNIITLMEDHTDEWEVNYLRPGIKEFKLKLPDVEDEEIIFRIYKESHDIRLFICGQEILLKLLDQSNVLRMKNLLFEMYDNITVVNLLEIFHGQKV